MNSPFRRKQPIAADPRECDPRESEQSLLVNRTLSLLAAVEPRAGLEQRVLARIAAAPATPWYQRLAPSSARWTMAAAASVVVLAGVVSAGIHRSQQGAPAPMALHAARPVRQAAAAAAAVATPSYAVAHTRVKTRHRGVHRAYRAMHDRVGTLPSGTIAPRRVPRIAPEPSASQPQTSQPQTAQPQTPQIQKTQPQ